MKKRSNAKRLGHAEILGNTRDLTNPYIVIGHLKTDCGPQKIDGSTANVEVFYSSQLVRSRSEVSMRAIRKHR